MSFFNPTLANPLAGGIPGAGVCRATARIAAVARLPSSSTISISDLASALAYRVDDKTVIRAGYGIFYAHAGGVGGRTNGRQG
jgi:hypothetical protein